MTRRSRIRWLYEVDFGHKIFAELDLVLQQRFVTDRTVFNQSVQLSEHERDLAFH